MKTKLYLAMMVFTLLWGAPATAGGLVANRVSFDLAKEKLPQEVWQGATVTTVSLMAQPMIAPRPKTVTTAALRVQMVHDGKWIAFRLSWDDPDRSEAGKLDEYSDALALQFPVNDGPPPPIFMGTKGQPVHILHWRAQYERDATKGKPEMKDLYPNMNVDMYPMEFADKGKIEGLTDEMRETYAHGAAAGNPQSYRKKSGVDELLAEGFGTSAVIGESETLSQAEWSNKQWTVVIRRPLKAKHDGTASFKPGKSTNVAFAVWQGGKKEVGARKSVTMIWQPLKLLEEVHASKEDAHVTAN